MNRRLPAEWEPQSGIMLTWPHTGTDWKSILHEVEPVYIEITSKTSKYEPVLIICNDSTHKKHISDILIKHGTDINRCQFHIAPSNDSWTRDHGPIFIFVDQKPVLLDFTFNGWGNKYPADKDNRIPSVLHDAGVFGKTGYKKIDFVLEGGSIENDGAGTLLTTTSCLLSKQRNPDMNMDEIEKKLSEYLGVSRVIWFRHGQLLGDDTDGHIDTLVRFVNRETIMYVTTDDSGNPNYESLKLMKNELHQLKQANGNPYRLIPLPSPVITSDSGQNLPASYANFLIINGAVLVPIYGLETDNDVINIFKESFNGRKIIPINCRSLIKQYGSLHCITMHLPKGVI